MGPTGHCVEWLSMTTHCSLFSFLLFSLSSFKISLTLLSPWHHLILSSIPLPVIPPNSGTTAVPTPSLSSLSKTPSLQGSSSFLYLSPHFGAQSPHRSSSGLFPRPSMPLSEPEHVSVFFKKILLTRNFYFFLS